MINKLNKAIEECGRYFLLMKQVFQKPEKWRIFFKQFFIECEKLVINSIPIIAIISVFIGGVIVLQSGINLENPFIPKMYVGYLARESLVLEFCSTMVALILAGKIGSNIASEIGSMRITEQIDAMDIMGVNSAGYLILPKIVSTVLFNPLIMLMSFMLGLVGGALIVYATGIVTITQYIDGICFCFNMTYIYYSMFKMAVFSFIITSVASFHGYYAKDGSLGVGRSSTKAIVISSGLILVTNLMITEIVLN